jgi:hypothetical protein
MNKLYNIMKYKILTIAILLVLPFVLSSCEDDDNDMSPGNPTLEIKSSFANMAFGDSLSFTVAGNDNVPLSTLTAQLFFGDEKVAETVIRTKTAGEYSGNIYVPYYKDIPNGTATLEFILKDTRLSVAKKTVDVPVIRPEYPYIILVTADKSYPMTPTGVPYEYAATEVFPSTDLPAYIKTPVLNENGNEITFGWEAGEIVHGSKGEIPFTSAQGGAYSVTFNTKTYQAAPFFELTVNGEKMTMADRENFRIDMNLTQGQNLSVEGIVDISEWWIDPDFFTKATDNEFIFVPVTGKYRIMANTALKYFFVETLSGNEPATLQPDGTGAIWIIGDNIGKPSLSANTVGWNTDKALCMSPVGVQKYQVTVAGGQQISTESINFKFFHQKGWGGEFSNTMLTTASDIVFVGVGEDSGRDPGNLGLVSGTTLEAGAVYVFTVDVSAGINNAVLTVVKK